MAKRYFGWLTVGLIAAIFLLPIRRVTADQGFYVIDQTVRPGMLMSVSATDPNVAEPATSEKASSLVGVLGDEPTSFDFQDGQKNILTGGVRNTLVTTVYGDIKTGDYITASSIVGLGGKLDGSGWVIGIAQADFSGSTAGAVKSTVSETGGTSRDVYVGTIPVLVKVLYYDDSQAVEKRDVSFIPESLQQIIDSIVGKRASQLAVVMASVLILAGLITGGIIVYSAIKTGITSTARQPLAKQAIVQKMIQACLIALAIVVISILGAFVIIRVL